MALFAPRSVLWSTVTEWETSSVMPFSNTSVTVFPCTRAVVVCLTLIPVPWDAHSVKDESFHGGAHQGHGYVVPPPAEKRARPVAPRCRTVFRRICAFGTLNMR